MECREDYRYNLEAVDSLIRSQLVNMPQYDLHLAHSLENGLNYMAVTFAMQLVQLYLVDDRINSQISETDLLNTIEMLARIATHSRTPPEGFVFLFFVFYLNHFYLINKLFNKNINFIYYRLGSLIEILRANHDPALLVDRAQAGPTAHIHSGIMQVTILDI